MPAKRFYLFENNYLFFLGFVAEKGGIFILQNPSAEQNIEHSNGGNPKDNSRQPEQLSAEQHRENDGDRMQSNIFTQYSGQSADEHAGRA